MCWYMIVAIEVVINKALKEENPEKRQGFANAIAYYMKLTYSNWHKELVHDDNIQTELQSMTDGQLEFNNRPFVKHRVDNRTDDYPARGANNGYRKNFSARNNNTNAGRDNRSSNTGRDNRTGGGNNRPGGDNRNNNNRNFKKRF